MGLIVPRHIMEERREIALRKTFEDRYSKTAHAPRDVVAAIRKIDPDLSLKVYLPTGKWHVVRYPNGRSPDNAFVRCITLEDNPNMGKRKSPGMWLVEYLNKCDTQKENKLDKVEQYERERELAREKEVEDIALNLAEDLRKPLLSDIDGDNATTTVWQGGI